MISGPRKVLAGPGVAVPTVALAVGCFLAATATRALKPATERHSPDKRHSERAVNVRSVTVF
jgi:hypothetical protein